MAAVTGFVEVVKDKKKQFARELSELTGLPLEHFKINDVSALFSVAAASVALHELKGGSLAGRLPFQELSGAMAIAVIPEGAHKSTLNKIWGLCKRIKSPDDFGWGELREIGNYLDIDVVEVASVFKKVDICHHDIARQTASGGAIIDTLFTSGDATSAGVKVDSGAPEVTNPATEDPSPPTIDPTASNAEASEAPPNKGSATKRRASVRNKKRRDKSFSKDAREVGVLNPKTGL